MKAHRNNYHHPRGWNIKTEYLESAKKNIYNVNKFIKSNIQMLKILDQNSYLLHESFVHLRTLIA